PVPLSATLETPPPLLVTVSVVVFDPIADGVNVTCALVAMPGPSTVATGAPTVNCAASPPLMASGALSVIGNPLVLVMVTGIVPSEPRNTVPKSNGDGESAIDAAWIVTEYGNDPAQPCASVAVTVKVNVDAAVGVPNSTPAPENVKPVGIAPDEIE